MSMFSIPQELLPDLKKFEQMREEMFAMLPKQYASPVNLLAHPLAGVAAFSALGIGLASHAFGVWMGAVSGAAEISQRMFSPIYDDLVSDTQSFAEKRPSPASRAKSATLTLISDARSAAKEIAAEAAPPAAGEETVAVAELAPEVAPAVEATGELMPEDFRQPKSMDKPRKPDDLKTISGIGPKLETVLNGLGVWTFGQVAAWGREEVAWMDDYLGFRGRIGRDDWIGQAKGLARKKR